MAASFCLYFYPASGFACQTMSVFLKNVFFTDQMVLFFIYLFLLLELLKNCAGIENPVKRAVIDILPAVTVFAGMLTEYYFRLHLVAVCLVHFAGSLIRKEKAADIFKKLSVYIISALLAVGLFLLQITQFDGWRKLWLPNLRNGRDMPIPLPATTFQK